MSTLGHLFRTVSPWEVFSKGFYLAGEAADILLVCAEPKGGRFK